MGVPKSNPGYLSTWHFKCLHSNFPGAPQRVFDSTWLTAYFGHGEDASSFELHMSGMLDFFAGFLKKKGWCKTKKNAIQPDECALNTATKEAPQRRSWKGNAKLALMHSKDYPSYILRLNEGVFVCQVRKHQAKQITNIVVISKQTKHPKIVFAPCYLTNNTIKRSQMVESSNKFNTIVIICIFIAGVLVGIQSYPSMDGHPALSGLDNAVQIIFTIDCAFRIAELGKRPLQFW